MKKTFFLLIWLLLYNLTLAQVYPRLKSILVLTKISYEKNDSVFFFKYTLINPSNNIGNIISYEIDISVPPNSIRVDTVGLRFENDGFSEGHFRRRFPTLKDKIVPLSFLSSPGRWGGLFSNNLTAGWNGYPLIQPGETLAGFTLMSKGIPGIRRCIVSPRFDVDTLFPDIEDTTRTLTIVQMDSIQEAVKFRGWTLGPIAPPINFVPAVWIDTLISYKHKSRALGWIDNDGIVNSLDQKLENAKQQLQKGNTKSAKNIIQAFINEVEALHKEGGQAQNRKHLSSEAYALLKYNAEYLLEKMGGK